VADCDQWLEKQIALSRFSLVLYLMPRTLKAVEHGGLARSCKERLNP
jgi:hypothetical protein